jgi:hypothetical protein
MNDKNEPRMEDEYKHSLLVVTIIELKTILSLLKPEKKRLRAKLKDADFQLPETASLVYNLNIVRNLENLILGDLEYRRQENKA